MSPKVSIIVAVYNAERYLKRCLDSILHQTFSDFEVVIVDDGSIDNSPKICDCYAQQDIRFKVYHVSNGGVARARQYGIDRAEGIYCIHVDSDDWIDTQMLENMVRQMDNEELDMLIADYFVERNKREYNKQKLPMSDTESTEKNRNRLIEYILRGRLFGGLTNKMIKLNLIKRHNIRFQEDINYCEDVLVVAKCLLHDIKVAYHPHAYYHYFQNDNSITNRVSRKTYDNLMRYAAQLRINLPEYYSTTIDAVVLRININAYLYGIISREEYENSAPYGWGTLLLARNMLGITSLMVGIFNISGLFGLSNTIKKIRSL